MTKKQLKQFDNSKIQSMSLYINQTGKKNVTTVNLFTKNSTGKEIYINGKETDWSGLKEHIATENKKRTPYNNKSQEKSVSTTVINEKGIFVTGNPVAEIKIDSNKDILFVIDGKEISAEESKKLNPHDIENITILKDKNAIEKYGSKAKDGVIIVTTKSKKEVSLQQKAEALKARELAMQKRKQVINESKEKILQRKIERENLRKELTTKKDEIQKNVERRKKELEKLKQQQEKSRKNHRYVNVTNNGDGKYLEKDYETLNTIFKDVKK